MPTDRAGDVNMAGDHAGDPGFSTGLSRLTTDLTLSPGVHELVGQIRPPNMFWTPPGPPEDDPARHKSISEL